MKLLIQTVVLIIYNIYYDLKFIIYTIYHNLQFIIYTICCDGSHDRRVKELCDSMWWRVVSPCRWARWKWMGRSRPCVRVYSVRWSPRPWMLWIYRGPGASAWGATVTCGPSKRAARRRKRRRERHFRPSSHLEPLLLLEPSRAVQVQALQNNYYYWSFISGCKGSMTCRYFLCPDVFFFFKCCAIHIHWLECTYSMMFSISALKFILIYFSRHKIKITLVV